MNRFPSKPDDSIKLACETLGRKWTLEVLQQLLDRPLRFSELHKRLPWISTKSLARVLDNLEKDGVVQRTIVSARPPQVIYAMAHEDALLLQIIQLLSRWGAERSKRVAADPAPPPKH